MSSHKKRAQSYFSQEQGTNLKTEAAQNNLECLKFSVSFGKDHQRHAYEENAKRRPQTVNASKILKGLLVLSSVLLCVHAQNDCSGYTFAAPRQDTSSLIYRIDSGDYWIRDFNDWSNSGSPSSSTCQPQTTITINGSTNLNVDPFDYNGGELTIKTKDDPWAGSYSVVCTHTMGGDSSYLQTHELTVIIYLECDNWNWNGPSSSTYTAYVNQTPLSVTGLQNTSQFRSSSYSLFECSKQMTCTVDGEAPTTPFSISGDTLTVTPTLESQIGIYTVSCVHWFDKMAHYTQTRTFTVSIEVPMDCAGHLFNTPSVVSDTLTVAVDTLTVSDLDGYSFSGWVAAALYCDPQTFVKVNGGAVAAPFSYNAGTLTITPTVFSHVNTYTVLIENRMVGDANSLYSSSTITITIVMDCTMYTFAQPTTTVYDVSIGQTPVSVTGIAGATATGSAPALAECAPTVTCLANTAALAAPLSYSAGTLTITPTTFAHVNTYAVVCTQTMGNDAGFVSTTYEITVNVNLDCSAYSWTAPTPAKTTLVVDVDTLSVTGITALSFIAPGPVEADCGPTTEVLVAGLAPAVPFAYDGAGTLSVVPNSIDHVGQFKVTINHSMTNDADTSATYSFWLLIRVNCKGYSWAQPSPLSITIEVGAAAQTISGMTAYTAVGVVSSLANCGITDTILVNGAAAAAPFSLSGNLMTVTPTIYTQANQYIVTIDHTTNDLTHYESYEVIVTVYIDCSQFVFVPPSITTLQMNVGEVQTVTLLQQITDNGGPFDVLYCIPMHVPTIDDVAVAMPFSYDSVAGSLTIAPTLDEEAGTFVFNIEHFMQGDQRVVENFQVQITICPQAPLSVTAPIPPSAKEFTVGSLALTMDLSMYGDYELEPAGCFIVDRLEIYTVPPEKPLLVRLLDGTDILVLESQNTLEVGDYQVFVRAYFNDPMQTFNDDFNFPFSILEQVVETPEIASDFDLLPNPLQRIALTIGEDQQIVMSSLLEVEDQILTISVESYGGTETFLSFDASSLTFTAIGENVSEMFAGKERTVQLYVQDENLNEYIFNVIVTIAGVKIKVEVSVPTESTEEEIQKEADAQIAKENLAKVQNDFAWLFDPDTRKSRAVMDQLAKDLPWPVPMIVDVNANGFVQIEYSQVIQVNETDEERYMTMQIENMFRKPWLEVYLENKKTGKVTFGSKVLWNETSLANPENNSTENETLIAEVQQSGRRRRLQEIDSEDSEEVEMNMDFNWTLVEFEEDGMLLKLFFEEPDGISFDQKEVLFVNFTEPIGYVTSKEQKESTLPGFTTSYKVPKQMKYGFLAAAGLSGLMQTALTFFGLAVMILGTFTEASLQTLFGMLRNLQLSVHVICFKINVASQLKMLYAGLVLIVMFDFMEMIESLTDQSYRIFETTPLQSFSDEFSDVGYESIGTFENLGTMKFVIVYLGILTIFVLSASRLLKLCNKSLAKKKIKKFVESTNILQAFMSFVMQTYFDFAMMLFMYFVRSPDEETTFKDLPLEILGDYVCLYFSYGLAIICIAFYVFSLWFFSFKFTQLQTLRQLETLLENKATVVNIYSRILGAAETKFNFKKIDELDLPKKSSIVRVKRIKNKIEEQPIQEEFQEPIEIPISEWKIILPEKTLVQLMYPDFFASSILKTSFSFKIKLLRDQVDEDQDLVAFYEKIKRQADDNVFDVKILTHLQNDYAKVVSFKDGKMPWKDELKPTFSLIQNLEQGEDQNKEKQEKEFDWEANKPAPNQSENVFDDLEKVAAHPGLREQVIIRRYNLIKQGRGTILFKGVLYTEPEIERQRIEVQKSRTFDMMEPFFSDLEFNRPSTQLYFQFDITRRLAVAMVAVYLYGLPRVQMMCFIAMVYIQLLYLLSVQPFKMDELNYMESFNEAKNYIVSFLIFFCQCASLLDVDQQILMVDVVGWSCMALESFCIVVNLVVAIKTSIRYYARQAKEIKYKNAMKRARKFRKETKEQRKQAKIERFQRALTLVDKVIEDEKSEDLIREEEPDQVQALEDFMDGLRREKTRSNTIKRNGLTPVRVSQETNDFFSNARREKTSSQVIKRPMEPITPHKASSGNFDFFGIRRDKTSSQVVKRKSVRYQLQESEPRISINEVEATNHYLSKSTRSQRKKHHSRTSKSHKSEKFTEPSKLPNADPSARSSHFSQPQLFQSQKSFVPNFHGSSPFKLEERCNSMPEMDDASSYGHVGIDSPQKLTFLRNGPADFQQFVIEEKDESTPKQDNQVSDFPNRFSFHKQRSITKSQFTEQRNSIGHASYIDDSPMKNMSAKKLVESVHATEISIQNQSMGQKEKLTRKQARHRKKMMAEEFD